MRVGHSWEGEGIYVLKGLLGWEGIWGDGRGPSGVVLIGSSGGAFPLVPSPIISLLHWVLI